jgi:hypothetical protein
MVITTQTYYGAEEPSQEEIVTLVSEDRKDCTGCYFFEVDQDCTFVGDINCCNDDETYYEIIWRKLDA